MKASVFVGPKQFELRQLERPVAGPGEVVIRNRVCGVCGTDVHIYDGEPGSAQVSPPVVLGHEYAGEVTEVGPGVKHLSVGDHVTVDPNIYCGQCDHCRGGKKQLCHQMQAIGVTRNGGFAEYSLVPEGQAFLLEKEIPFEAGAMAEPLACCLHGIDQAGIRPGQTVCVIGGGAIGLMMLQLARLSGAARVLLSEPNEKRRQAARQLGADETVDPAIQEAVPRADVVIECVGNLPAVRSAFAFAKPGATVVLFSVPKPDAVFPLPLFEMYKKELTVKGSFVNPDTHALAVALINSGRIHFEPIITHRFSLDQLPEAIACQQGNDSIKVVVLAQ